ncbi:hypothetical protein MalM25_36090 [Planctomycetes bacterium MalM25]|nr:hypothetical protein MalM25_36090 [Planctomycetes bacterium MalM25]
MTPVSLFDLWLPILVAGVAVHVLSTIAWTAAPHHKPEWKPLPLDDNLSAALKGTEPGEQYLITTGEPGDMDPGKCQGMLIRWSHTPHMGKNIGMTLAFFLFTAFAIGYLASIALTKETPTLDVFRFTATAAFLAHVCAGIPTIIWFRRKFVMDLLDGLAYSLATGAAFALLWPQ